MLARKGFLLDPLTVESHTVLKKLPRQGLKWVARWQKRHGLTRGRFRQGCGLTAEQQRSKVRPLIFYFRRAFFSIAVVGFSVPNLWFRGVFFGPALRSVFCVRQYKRRHKVGPNSGLQNWSHLIKFRTECADFFGAASCS